MRSAVFFAVLLVIWVATRRHPCFSAPADWWTGPARTTAQPSSTAAWSTTRRRSMDRSAAGAGPRATAGVAVARLDRAASARPGAFSPWAVYAL